MYDVLWRALAAKPGETLVEASRRLYNEPTCTREQFIAAGLLLALDIPGARDSEQIWSVLAEAAETFKPRLVQ